MTIFLHILSNNILPVFILIGLGWALGKKFDIDIFTLSKLTFYLLSPSFIFYNLYVTELSFGMIKVLYFAVAYMVAADLTGRVIAKVRKFDVGMTNAFKNAIMFNNSGNIGISLITLVFGGAAFVVNGKTPYLHEALTAQVLILLFMNITVNTVCFFNAGRANIGLKKSIRRILGMPSIYVIPLALILGGTNVDITALPLWPALILVKDALVPIALLTLGIQLSKNECNFKDINVHIAVFTRLVLGPLLAIAGIYVFGFTGVVAQTLLISYSVPTAVNVALIAAEYDNQPRFASQQVMMSTVFSAITLTVSIYMAAVLFPV